MPRPACWPSRHSTATALTPSQQTGPPWKASGHPARSNEGLGMALRQAVSATGCPEKAPAPMPCLSAVGSRWRPPPLAEGHPTPSQRACWHLSQRARRLSCLSNRYACSCLSALLQHVPTVCSQQLEDLHTQSLLTPATCIPPLLCSHQPIGGQHKCCPCPQHSAMQVHAVLATAPSLGGCCRVLFLCLLQDSLACVYV